MGPFSNPVARFGAVLWTACLGACLSGGDGKSRGVKVKPELMRAQPPLVLEKPAAAGRNPLAAPAWSSDLAITTFKVPLKRISLHNASFTKAVDLYVCQGSGVECEVEAAGNALQNELDADPVMVDAGEYRYVQVKTCEDSEGEYTAALTATVSLEGRTWHTHPTAILDTAGPARPLFIRAKGCLRTYALPHPLVISESLGAQVSFKLYFDPDGLAHAALGSRRTARAWSPDNCAGSRPADSDIPGDPFLCIGYPELSGVVDSVPLVLERYRINGGATLGLFFTGGTGLPIGGFTRRFFREGAEENPGFNAVMPLRDLSLNQDGTLSLAAFGAGFTGQKGSEFKVEAFKRENHEGDYTGLPDSAGVGMPGKYRAQRL